MNHAEIINACIKKFNLKSYLELGTFDRELNFNKIECEDKFCVDVNPMCYPDFIGTTDEFFESYKERYGCIFIDGDHSHEQSYKDIVNSINSLSDDGVIICHDCIPTDEKMQRVPREQLEWVGQVWKSILKLRMERTDIECFVINSDYGCAVIRKGKSWAVKTSLAITYENFVNNKKSWLNIISVEQFEKWLKK